MLRNNKWITEEKMCDLAAFCVVTKGNSKSHITKYCTTNWQNVQKFNKRELRERERIVSLVSFEKENRDLCEK